RGVGRGDQSGGRAGARCDRGRRARGRAARVLPRAAREVQAAEEHRLQPRAAARPERQAVQAPAARSVLGGKGARDLRRSLAAALAAIALAAIAWAALAVFAEGYLNRVEPAEMPEITPTALALHEASFVADLHAD